MKLKHEWLGVLLAGSLFCLHGCNSYNNKKPSVTPETFYDKDAWYANEVDHVMRMDVTFDDPNEYLCRPYNNLSANKRPCTFNDINHDINPNDDYEPKLHVRMQAEGFDAESGYNASFKLKGNFSRTNAQKSYALKLDSKEHLFLGQRYIHLNKSESDRSRLRNRVAYSLLRQIPHIVSLQLNYIHLFVNGKDYGLFNQPEVPRKEYLKNRGWDEEDCLYNANNFQFVYDPYFFELDKDGKPKYPERFNSSLEIKSGSNHTKLIEMLKAVNSDQDIDKVISKYFDRDNLMTWLAVNLLLNNKDTSFHNFYLYHPRFSDKFYFIPWDYDGAWETTEYMSKWEYGISTWWAMPLMRKFFLKKKNRDDLYALAEKLRQTYLSYNNIKAIVDKYLPWVLPFQSVNPDAMHNSPESCIEAATRLYSQIDYNMALYKSVIGHPMPFEEDATYKDGVLVLQWDPSIDLEGDPIYYSVEFSKGDPRNIIYENPYVKQTKLQIPISLDPGVYYLKVTSFEEGNPSHYQTAYTNVHVGDTKFYGVKRIIIP